MHGRFSKYWRGRARAGPSKSTLISLRAPLWSTRHQSKFHFSETSFSSIQHLYFHGLYDFVINPTSRVTVTLIIKPASTYNVMRQHNSKNSFHESSFYFSSI